MTQPVRQPCVPFEALPSRVRSVILAVLEQHRGEATLEEVMADDRRKPVAVVRWRIYWTLRKMPWRDGVPSFPEIGRWMGGRDHSSVMHGVSRYEALTADVTYRDSFRLAIMSRAYELQRQEYTIKHPHPPRVDETKAGG